MMENNKSLPVKDPGFVIPEDALERDAYAVSLIRAGIRAGACGERDNDVFTAAVLDLLAENIAAFSGGESTSVREETAEQMVDSILYLIGLGLQKEPTPEIALTKLLASGARTIYDEGLAVINRMIREAELLRLLLVRTRKTDQSDEYNRFIDLETKKYIESYTPMYDAHCGLRVKIPELAMKKMVHGLYEVMLVMRQVLEYNQDKKTSDGRIPSDGKED